MVRCALLQDLPFFKAGVTFRVPQAEIPELKDRARETIANLKGVLGPNFHAQLEAQLAEIQTYIDNHVVPLPASETPDFSGRVSLNDYRRTTVVDQELVARLRDPRATLEAESDETTHLSLVGASLVLVDAGNPATAAYVDSLASRIRVSSAAIFLTHFHSDHSIALAATISTLVDRGIIVNLVIPEEAMFQAVGYFMSNPEVLGSIISSPLVNLHLITSASTFSINNASQMAVMAPPAAIGHFITSRGYVQTDRNGNGRCYSGDINPGAFNPLTSKPYTEAEVKAGLREYFFALVKKAVTVEAREIDLFIDYGHFPPVLQEYISGELQRDLGAYCRGQGANFALHLDHQKNNEGYTLKV